MKQISLATKITLLMFSVVLLSLLASGYIGYAIVKNSEIRNAKRYLEAKSRLFADKLDGYTNSALSSAKKLNTESSLVDNLASLSMTYDSLFNYDSLHQMVITNLEAIGTAYTEEGIFDELTILNNDLEVLYSSRQDLSQGDFLELGQALQFTTEVGFRINVNEERVLIPFSIKGVGKILAEIESQTLIAQISDTTSAWQTEELMIGFIDGSRITLLNQPNLDTAGLLKRGVPVGANVGRSMKFALDGEAGSAQMLDYRGQMTLSCWAPVPSASWGLVFKIDEREIVDDSRKLLSNLFYAGLLILVLATLAAFIFTGVLMKPVQALQSTVRLLGNGVLPKKVNRTSSDEIGQMADTINNLVQGLRRTADFANKIGTGDFESEFKPMSEDDTLGMALIDMKENIQQAEIRDKQRNWIVTGVAEIGDILRKHDQLDALGDEVISFITDKIEAIQGAFYVLNDDDEEELFLEMKASYAYNKKKYLKGKFRFAEGLVGQSAIEKDTILRIEIPEDYVTITSGILGDQKPSCILIVPLITNEKVYGVVELAGFKRFTERSIKFVEEVSVIIAQTIFNIKVNERTRKLLDDSQKLTEELQIQQNELRQNAEEMEATQEELKRTNQRLEDQIEEVNRTQNRMQLLLMNAAEVISIFEENGTVRYISPSVQNILGYTQEEMIGLDDSIHVHPDYKVAYENMFVSLKANPEEPVTIQFEYFKKNGETIWLEATGRNLLSDPSIQGILLNSTDITERRRAEQEERMRSKMQSLSENSPDLITRFDNEGKFFYINPVIETYTGKKPNDLLQQNLNESDLDEKLVNQWMTILQEVEQRREKLEEEIDFPSDMGERIMQVNAIPEFDEDRLESVLLVSHDITERKNIEIEIQTKNKKISESINYAKRIQGAILPNTQIIKRVLPESFILYKAKDVVSGDFPWYLQVEDDIFIAAVDCTGHGVPGALISLIGYFLLNDIVRSRRISDPGEILDLLDEGVTKTLRQDQEDSKTKDGMDIALCKINLDKSELEYAGAHRSLYFMDKAKDELVEVKGNKFPIGGGVFKNQTNFTNTKIKFAKGDSAYFCSDGFPDQFGGPDIRKFGPKRLRNLIREYHSKKKMEDIHEIFAKEWDTWKGDEKQTDDVLLIGIRF
jgi:PAS domain S-box-containing protein